MAALSKSFMDRTITNSLEIEISLIHHKLFFETFLDVILYLQAFCWPSNCWELHHLLNRYLHCHIDGCESIEPRMAVPVFDSVEHFLKKVNVKNTKVIHHGLMFNTAITSFCFRNKCSTNNFNRVLFDRLKTSLLVKVVRRILGLLDLPQKWHHRF